MKSSPSAKATPNDLFGYAPSGTARVVLQVTDGRRLTMRTIPAWPGSGIVFYGPSTLPAQVGVGLDAILTTYDSAGHVLREVPLIFIQ